jgi:hypothetical protein
MKTSPEITITTSKVNAKIIFLKIKLIVTFIDRNDLALIENPMSSFVN